MTRKTGAGALLGALAVATFCPAVAVAQQSTQPGWPQTMNNNPILAYAILNQSELRMGSGDDTYRWDGEGWFGGNQNRVWFSTEGNLNTRTEQLDDAEAQLLYSRAVSPFFDLQIGDRYDFGSGPERSWAVIGVEGLAPYYFQVGAHAYVSGGGVAARLEGSYDLHITQRLVLQPQIEMNFYGTGDSRRGYGSGLSDIDGGLRLRYEIARQFAPYVGVTYEGKYGGTADLTREAGNHTSDVRFLVGIRLWL